MARKEDAALAALIDQLGAPDFGLEFYGIPEGHKEQCAPCELACLHVVEGRGYVEGMGQLRSQWEGLGAMAGKWLLVCPACAGHIKGAIETGGLTLMGRQKPRPC